MPLLRGYLALLALWACHVFANAELTDRSVTLWSWPLSAASPKQLASISYNLHTLTHSVSKYTPPSLDKDSDEVVRVGLYDPKAEPSWRGVAISPETFSSQYQQLLTLHIDSSGEVHHVGLFAQPHSDPVTKKPRQNELKVELALPTPGPVPPLNKPVVVTAAGKIEGKEEEKSFIQKYWWMFALFLLFQMLMAGGKEEK